MSKFTADEKALLKNIVAALTIKRIPDSDIIEEIQHKTGKSISRQSIHMIRHEIRKDSYDWYCSMRQGQYEYIHEFKERIKEIVDLQRRHYKIIEENPNATIQQTSLAELHKLNITLSNYFDVAPTIVKTNPTTRKENDNTVSIPQKDIIV